MLACRMREHSNAAPACALRPHHFPPATALVKRGISGAHCSRRFAGQLRGLCDDLLPMLQSRLTRDAPLLRLTCKNFHVAKLSCSSSSGVTCYANRLEYKFLWGRKTQVRGRYVER